MTSRKYDDEALSANYDVINIFPIYSGYAAIQNEDCRCLVYDSYIWSNSTLLSYKKWRQLNDTSV